MNAVIRALRAAYFFFAGDSIILTGVALAFIVGLLLSKSVHAPNVLVAVVFVALIVGGLVVTLGRELGGRRRVS